MTSCSAAWSSSASGRPATAARSSCENSRPITAPTFVLIPKDSKDAAKTGEVIKFFEWAIKNGQKSATELDYVPMPAATFSLIQAEWKKITDASGKAVF